MPLPRNLLLITCTTLSLIGLASRLYLQPSVTRAESIQIFATVGIDEYDFQLELSGPPTSSPVGPNSVLTYKLTYGSHLKTPTELVVLRVTWSQGLIGDGQLVDLLEYIEGSATPAIGGAMPNIDIANRTITWQIAPLPPGENREVSWQLRTKSANVSSNPSFTISAALIGPDFEKIAAPLSYNYLYTAPSTQPTPTIQPTLVPVTPTPAGPRPSSNLLEQLGPTIAQIVEIVEKVARGGGALVVAPIPLLLILIPTITQLVPLLSQVPWWQIIPLLMALFWAQPKKAWGVVFDSKTKQPIDPAIITLIDKSGRERTTISDFYGRYQFLVEPGTYSITVKKTNYLFPSSLLSGLKTDGVYDDLYFGGHILVENMGLITYNIPLDAAVQDWNQAHKLKVPWHNRWATIGKWLFWVGCIWSIGMFSLYPSLLNGLVLGMYGVLWLLRWLQRIRAPWGVVYDSQGQPIDSALVGVTNLNNPLSRRPPVITKSGGRFSFLVEHGKYQLNVALKTGDTFSAPSPGPEIEIKGKHGHIATDLTVSSDATPSDKE